MMIIPYMVRMLMTLIEEIGGDYDATYDALVMIITVIMMTF